MPGVCCSGALETDGMIFILFYFIGHALYFTAQTDFIGSIGLLINFNKMLFGFTSTRFEDSDRFEDI